MREWCANNITNFQSPISNSRERRDKPVQIRILRTLVSAGSPALVPDSFKWNRCNQRHIKGRRTIRNRTLEARSESKLLLGYRTTGRASAERLLPFNKSTNIHTLTKKYPFGAFVTSLKIDLKHSPQVSKVMYLTVSVSSEHIKLSYDDALTAA